MRSLVVSVALLLLVVWAPDSLARQWYEHYERGLEAAQAGRWGDALSEFEEAAKLEPKARSRLRTYGRQFLVAYDPAYQRARCLVELGRAEEARPLLAEAQAAAVTAPELLAALASRLVPATSTARPAASRPLVPEPRLPAGSQPASPSPQPETSVPKPPAEPVGSPDLPVTPSAALTPLVTAKLSVRSTPSGARLSLDGRVRGTTPLLGLEVSPGAHRVHLEGEGLVPWEQVVTLVAGEPLGLEVSLATLPPAPVPVEIAAGELKTPPEPEAGASAEPAVPPAAAADPSRQAFRGRLVAGGLVALMILLLLGLKLRRHHQPPPPTASTSGLWHVQLLGSRLADYELQGELGRGGMASTFRAQRRRDGRVVALKVPHPSGDETYRERFLREGRLGEALHHPAIVRILEAGEDRGVPFIAMELVEGQTLKQVLAEHPLGLSPEHAIAVARAIAEALDYAHGKGVVHRDLKPENVMLTTDGGVKVMDFGVARVADQPGLTTSEFFLGSPLYAAPEAIEPQRIGPPSDLYSLGILIYEMVTGQLPFVHESIYKLLELHQSQPLPSSVSLPRPVVLPEPLWLVIEKLCAKRPEDRYPSAQALLVELGRLAESGGEP